MAKRAIVEETTDATQLMAFHAQLDRRVKELDRRAYLTPAEQQELAALKKQKLALKDRIRASQPPTEPAS
jgi:uncharacterized protein YdcH (DUF465 family)